MKRLITALLVTMFFAGTSHAETTPWTSGLGHKARLIMGAMADDGHYHGGFEVELEDGWKTYWRQPGGNGIPPLFDVKNSSNLKNFKVSWPAPQVFKDGSGKGVGYKKRVLLPFAMKPEDIDQSVDFNLSIFFGVCAEICVPVDVNFSTLLSPNKPQTPNFALIEEALSQVPVSSDDLGLQVKSAAHLTEGDNEYVDLQVQLSKNVEKLVVLVEGPEDWYFEPLNIPMTVAGDAGTQKVRVPLYRAIKDSLKGDEALRLTIIADGEALDQTIALN
ncbi:MAG: protein-disulfide reductase DsbD domain-containing protein [Hyphomicrobiales bacterium]